MGIGIRDVGFSTLSAFRLGTVTWLHLCAYGLMLMMPGSPFSAPRDCSVGVQGLAFVWGVLYTHGANGTGRHAECTRKLIQHLRVYACASEGTRLECRIP